MDTWLVILILGQLVFVSFLIWLGVYAGLQKGRQRTDERLRILERFQSSDELSTFLASPSGQEFLHVFGHPRTHADPKHAVLRALGIGIVVTLLGVGFLLLTRVDVLDEPEIFYIPGVLGSVGGIGILIAATVTMVGIRRWGLEPRQDDAEL